MNPTIDKFGYPGTLVREYEHWVVLVRAAQPTLGALVLAARSDATAYGALPAEAFAEQAIAIADIERALAGFVAYERINYLMLMMVDPNVHFHVIPRYAEPRKWNGIEFPDAGWPGQPQLGSAVQLTRENIALLRAELCPTSVNDSCDNNCYTAVRPYCAGGSITPGDCAWRVGDHSRQRARSHCARPSSRAASSRVSQTS
jgi:diadenosine tetraphosphate (Ap4A) HIT family hydrolase